MNAGDPIKLAALLKKLGTRFDGARKTPPAPRSVPGDDPLVLEAIHAMLVWEASTPIADDALRRFCEQLVDWNELRVCSADDLADMLGPDYPLRNERAARLRAMLRDIGSRAGTLSLAHLRESPRRQARAFVESLEGVPPFVARRLCVLGLGIHAIPVDERLRALLEQAKVVNAQADALRTSQWLERAIKADESLHAALTLQAWSDADGRTFDPEAALKPLAGAPPQHQDPPARPRKPPVGARSQTKQAHPEKARKQGRTPPATGSGPKTRTTPRSGTPADASRTLDTDPTQPSPRSARPKRST